MLPVAPHCDGPSLNAYHLADSAHLPALHLLLTGTEPAAGRRRRTRRGVNVRGQISEENVIGYLRDHGITLTWDPTAGTLQSGTCEAAKTIIRKQAEPGRSAPTHWKEEKKTAGRPALAQACARVTSRPARKRALMGF